MKLNLAEFNESQQQQRLELNNQMLEQRMVVGVRSRLSIRSVTTAT